MHLPVNKLTIAAGELRRRLASTDQKMIMEYLVATEAPKLHLGCGGSRPEGWLNTDACRLPGVVRMDATSPFPFEEGSFSYVYSEHMIEHVPFKKAKAMVGECYRVLKPGGMIRIVTPDLASLIKLNQPSLNESQKEYLSFFYREFIGDDQPATPVGVLNAQFRMWGHQFLYDEATLRDLLADAGFSTIKRWPVGVSANSALENLENSGRYPSTLLDFESVALEAQK